MTACTVGGVLWGTRGGEVGCSAQDSEGLVQTKSVLRVSKVSHERKGESTAGPENISKLEERRVQHVSSPAGRRSYQSISAKRGGTQTGCQAGRRRGGGLECHVRCYSPRCWTKALAEGFVTRNDGFLFQKSLYVTLHLGKANREGKRAVKRVT